MRTIKMVFRALKWLGMLYALWRTAEKSRLVLVAIALLRLFQRRPILTVPRPQFMIVDASDPRIYRRRGWRKLVSRRT